MRGRAIAAFEQTGGMVVQLQRGGGVRVWRVGSQPLTELSWPLCVHVRKVGMCELCV